jgi:hypothetical protein
VLAALVIAQPIEAHPLHTSLAEITYDPAAREIRVSVRVFVDDFSRASSAYAATKSAAATGSGQGATGNGRRVTGNGQRVTDKNESPLLMYARASFMIADRAGRSLSLASCGGKRVGDLIWICFHTSAPSGPARFQVADRILFDLYADQINIVQATYGGKKVSLLFTHGDGFKRLD